MFFSPTVLALKRQGKEVRGLCLSVGESVIMPISVVGDGWAVGNADGLGPTRAQELASSYSVLGLQHEEVDVLDHSYVSLDSLPRMIYRAVIQRIARRYQNDMECESNCGYSG